MAILLFATAETEEEEDAAMLISCLILQEEEAINNIRRYGTRGPYRRDLVGGLYKIMMSSFSERQFKVWMRMDRTTFLYVLDLIKNDPIFVSNNPLSPQRPVSHQLATFLCRVGNENALKSSTVMGVSEGTNGVDDGDGEEDEECVNEEFRAWAEDQEGAIPGIDVDADLYKMGLYRRKLLVELMQQEEEDN
ncbi:hypothetical protein FB107DRAFT_274078 [Schizophyllum commune]